MRNRVRNFAHTLERSGLAMAGAACGLFVGAHVGSNVAWLTTQGFLLVMMISGAIGFYLGIDTPPLSFHPAAGTVQPNSEAGVDTPEFLTALGTFFATLAAFISVGVIVLREEPHIALTYLVMLVWVGGVVMQIVAGAIARMRK